MSTAPQHRTALLDPAGHRPDCACAVCRAAGRMTATELLARANRAAALELRGPDWRDVRPDCAAHLIARALEDTAGGLPQRDDSAHSLTVYCGRARNYRRSIERQRERDSIAHADASDRAAHSRDALAPQAQREEREDSEREHRDSAATAATAATAAAQRIAPNDDNVRTLVYRCAREDSGLTGPEIARELKLTAAALRKRCERATAKLAADSTATAMLRAMHRTAPRERWQWTSVQSYRTTAQRTRTAVAQRIAPLSLDYATADSSRAAGGRHSTAGGQLQRERAADWRTRPDRPLAGLPDSAREIAPLQHSRTRKRTAKLAQRTAEELTAARSAALTAEIAATRPTPHSSGSAAMRRHSAKSDNRATATRNR